MQELLEEYLGFWDLSNPEIIEETPTSHVYKVEKDQQPCVLKLYTALGRKHEATGPEFLKICDSCSVVAVIEHNEGAALLEYIDGAELVTLIDSNKDEQATRIIAQILNKIHRSPIPAAHNFKSLEEHMSAIFRHAKLDSPDIIKQAAPFARELLDNQREICLLHADMHHKNVMRHAQRGWLALDPQCAVGDRAYDCANTLHNPNKRADLTENHERLIGQAAIMGQEMDIKPQRIIDFAYIHGCLSACWTKEDDGYYGEDALKTSRILEKYISRNK